MIAATTATATPSRADQPGPKAAMTANTVPATSTISEARRSDVGFACRLANVGEVTLVTLCPTIVEIREFPASAGRV
jgi:hypothetical protein